MSTLDDEDQLLRSVALQNANSILLARHRAEAELLQAKEALRQNEERLRAIFNQAAVGIAVASLDGRFLDMNAKFTQILGYSAAELSGLTFAALTHPDDQHSTAVCVSELLAGTRSEYALEKRFIRKNGSSVWSLTTVTLLKDPKGKPQRFIGVIEDISARKRAEEALLEKTRNLELLNEERTMLLESERAARTAAERMSEMKDEFLATLSHELRTPLNAILGWSQVLRTGSRGEADYVKGLETIERNARMQTQLIEDLLDMSRITSGKLRMDVQWIQPVALVQAAVETVTPAANAKGIRLEQVLDPAAGPISGDPGRLQQVVWNLLSNAIKFTARDGKVQIVLQRIDAHIEIKVADTGIGVRPDFIPHLFERFRQGDASTTRKYGGLGLGLSIVKSLVELHGGTVSVSSEGEGKGTTVTVRLPLTAVHRHSDHVDPVHPKTARDAVAQPPNASELAGLKVLVVDDQRDARDLVKRVLEDSGAEVLSVGSATEALRVLTAWRPEVLVTDIGMPDADGYELLRKVRAIGAENGGKVPAIALTAFARSEDRTRALRAGFAVHVSKPVDPAELVASVASVAGRVTDSS